ncbi:predicted protein [Histoplasma capsulatum G186AR]|uniref:Uncharacterized protein n=1 Tax=Ajellomyces capsulatus (strain G186AR / H82 / ATCC MYA-2454 / RMSCC 2432) TaxID=447093 RepID=C0NE63_AJECG|nr:uncharacterized protein HCBG_02156 [Histoplasma capsulatum G186AR]EEH10511.1 predicted protein [Histoplasma capsulatum G186AR]
MGTMTLFSNLLCRQDSAGVPALTSLVSTAVNALRAMTSSGSFQKTMRKQGNDKLQSSSVVLFEKSSLDSNVEATTYRKIHTYSSFTWSVLKRSVKGSIQARGHCKRNISTSTSNSTADILRIFSTTVH